MPEGSSAPTFRTVGGFTVPSVTADQMREVDRIAVEDLGLGILQMMENAGRSLAENVLEMIGAERGEVAILAGSGGNGGGGLCCARHLRNQGLRVSVVLTRPPADLEGAAGHQFRILWATGLEPVAPGESRAAIRRAQLVVDALVGYSLQGAPRGRVAELIGHCNEEAHRVLSLDLPSGLDATTGESPGVVVRAERTVTLALPKRGLWFSPESLVLADIGIPPEAYRRLGLSFRWPDAGHYWLTLKRERSSNGSGAAEAD